jgi:hypothetical protein
MSITDVIGMLRWDWRASLDHRVQATSAVQFSRFFGVRSQTTTRQAQQEWTGP